MAINPVSAANKGSTPPGPPQRPAPRPPQAQQATSQQQGNQPPSKGSPSAQNAPASQPPPAAGQRPGGPPMPPQNPSTKEAKPAAPGQAPSGKTPPPGPKSGPEQTPLPEGPSPELQNAYKFLEQYVSEKMPPGSLPPGMINDLDAETRQPSPLINAGSAIPTTVTGAAKVFPKYSLSIGSPSSPNLLTGQNLPSVPVAEPNLIAGLAKSNVKINQMNLKNV